jgi:DNA processing protein
MQEILLSATLSRYSSLYNIKLLEIVNHYGSLNALYEEWETSNLSIPDTLKPLLDRSWQTDQFQEMEKGLALHSIKAFKLADPEYPALLREISDPPYVLYVKGDISTLTTATTVSCVGTRNITPYGKRAISHLLTPLKGYNLCIVSGLALGVDAEVHRVAINQGIKTVGVLGAGLDKYEPLTNQRLGEEIVQTACLISEYPPGVRPQKHHFLERNRIIAGLSKATVVIEGKRISGALVTAKYALQYGREAGCVPGDIFISTSQGTNSLLSEGAWCVTESGDILAMLGIEAEKQVSFGPPKNEVHALLAQAPLTSDMIQVKLGVSIQEVQQQLTVLEMDGLLVQTPSGEYYAVA